MRKRGRTAAGTQRWQCPHCGHSGVRRRDDVRARHFRGRFIAWLSGTASLAHVARTMGVSRRQAANRFAPFWCELPPRPTPVSPDAILILDGVYLSGRTNAALIARTLDAVRAWHFAERECFDAWDTFLARLRAPTVVVMDGQKGLHAAVLRRFPHARIQRCLVHVERFVRMCLSARPKTEAGQALWSVMRSIWNVRTPAEAKTWCARFAVWDTRHTPFLKERSRSPETGRWWYTHRKLRAARSHIANALPYLFTFTEIAGAPRTTNHVEGGVNARLKELVRRHRGLSPERKRILAAHFLISKTVQKPPRDFT